MFSGLTELYGVQNQKISFDKSYYHRLEQAREACRKAHSTQTHLIVVDENVILSPDFLFFLAQTYKTMTKDDTLSSISAWSPNCYKHEGDVHLVYRIQGSPKYAALVPINAKDDVFGDMVVPDVSRAQGPRACHFPSLQAGMKSKTLC